MGFGMSYERGGVYPNIRFSMQSLSPMDPVTLPEPPTSIVELHTHKTRILDFVIMQLKSKLFAEIACAGQFLD